MKKQNTGKMSTWYRIHETHPLRILAFWSGWNNHHHLDEIFIMNLFFVCGRKSFLSKESDT